jgi:hypothetical protein
MSVAHRKINQNNFSEPIFIRSTLKNPNKLLKKVIKNKINNKLVFVVLCTIIQLKIKDGGFIGTLLDTFPKIFK